MGITEENLKPCKCGCEAKLGKIDRPGLEHFLYFGECSTCWRRSEIRRSAEEAIAAWNAYVDPAPAPKWTDEVPTEEGRYWVYEPGQPNIIYPVRIFFKYGNNRKKIRMIIDELGEGTLKRFCERYPEVQWQPIPEPPLPAKQEETP